MPNSRDPDLSFDSEVTAASGTTQKNKIVKQEDDQSRKQVLVQSIWILITAEVKSYIQWGSLYSFVKSI